eukprot:scaffold26463_cov25-Prasinocladus_malaysianus.AAC.1
MGADMATSATSAFALGLRLLLALFGSRLTSKSSDVLSPHVSRPTPAATCTRTIKESTGVLVLVLVP